MERKKVREQLPINDNTHKQINKNKIEKMKKKIERNETKERCKNKVNNKGKFK